jgi:hypothetical protein
MARSPATSAGMTAPKGDIVVKRIVVLCIAVGAFALWAQAGSAQAPTTTTLTFYEPEAGGTFKIVDNAPKSPTKNPESRKYRFSVGDELIFSQNLLNQKGGTRQGTIYGDFRVVKGKTFNSIVVIGQVTYVLTNGDQIDAHGVFQLAASDVRGAVTGGTGAYLGARGQVASHNNADGSSQDTLTIIK